MDERGEHRVEFVEVGKDVPKAFEATEGTFDFIAPAIPHAILLPRRKPVGIGRDNGSAAKFQSQLPGFVALIGPLHEQVARGRCGAPGPEQRAPLRGVAGLPGGERETQGAPSMRGHQMNLGGPASARFAEGWRAVFLKPPCRRDAL
jgi:hypothetical protein